MTPLVETIKRRIKDLEDDWVILNLPRNKMKDIEKFNYIKNFYKNHTKLEINLNIEFKEFKSGLSKYEYKVYIKIADFIFSYKLIYFRW